MRRALIIVSLAALSLGPSACTETADTYVFVSPEWSSPEGSGWAHFVVIASTNTEDEPPYRMKLNGAWWMYSTWDDDAGQERLHYHMLNANEAMKAPVPQGFYQLELVRDNGDTALITEPFSVETGRDLTLVVFGEADALEARTFIDVYDAPYNEPIDWYENGGYADVPSDHVKVRVLNAADFYGVMDVELCDGAGCTPAATSIPYGNVYEAIVPATYTMVQTHGTDPGLDGTIDLTTSTGAGVYLVLPEFGQLAVQADFFGPM
jgi:hypothetical protein